MIYKLLNNNKGSATILLALMMTVLMGSCALAVDVGRVILEEQKLQNAIDAASLAAASDLPDTTQAAVTANQYMELNGYIPEDITITFSESDKRINITGTKEVEYTLAKVLGLTSKTVSPSASAALGSIGAAFNYVLFSGSTTKDLNFNGSNLYIGGSSHTNKKFNINGSNQTITGVCEAVSTININGSNIDINQRVPNAGFVEMPDFFETIKIQAQKAGQFYEGNKNFNGSNIRVNEPIYVNGNISINGSNFIGKGCVLATGDISFNGSNLNSSSDDAVCFYSKTGDITINGSNAIIDGILYAPEGKVNSNGSNQTIHGRVIGNQVQFNGSNIKIIGGTKELLSLPFSSVKLIK